MSRHVSLIASPPEPDAALGAELLESRREFARGLPKTITASASSAARPQPPDRGRRAPRDGRSPPDHGRRPVREREQEPISRAKRRAEPTKRPGGRARRDDRVGPRRERLLPPIAVPAPLGGACDSDRDEHEDGDGEGGARLLDPRRPTVPLRSREKLATSRRGYRARSRGANLTLRPVLEGPCAPASVPTVCIAVVGAVTFAAIEPRFHTQFPSMIDDWARLQERRTSSARSPPLGNPEPQRYRPGFIVWNALQWHTLGCAEGQFVGPSALGLARFAVLVVRRHPARRAPAAPRVAERRALDPRRLLVAGVPVAALTALACVDLARYGPQEPLLVGCMALGAVLLVRGLERLLAARGLPAATLGRSADRSRRRGRSASSRRRRRSASSCSRRSCCPTIAPAAALGIAWRDRRLGSAGLAAGILLPVRPDVDRGRSSSRWRTSGSTRTSRPSRASPAPRGSVLASPSEVLHSHAAHGDRRSGARSRLVLRASGMASTGFGRLSRGRAARVRRVRGRGRRRGERYLLPAIVSRRSRSRAPRRDSGRASSVRRDRARRSSARSRPSTPAAGSTVGRSRARPTSTGARGSRPVGRWLRGRVTGLNVELVQALPVLVPLADERGRDCRRGERYVVVIDPGGPGTGPPRAIRCS